MTISPIRARVLLLIAIALVASNLRMTITAVGPLLDEIAADQGVSVTALGALGSVPLLAWALVSPVTHWASARFGIFPSITWSLVVLAAGTIWRSLPGSPANLWIGTALIGVGIAFGNVLLPAVVKTGFPNHVPAIMAGYSSLVGGVASLGAGLAVPLSQLAGPSGDPLGWRVSLMSMGALVPVALIVWIWAGRRHPLGHPTAGTAAGMSSSANGAGRRIWGDPLAWLVSIYMGTQSTAFYVIVTWFAAYRTDHGATPVGAGLELMSFQILGIAGSLLIPLAGRGRARRWTPAALPATGLIAWIGFVVAPGAVWAWVVIGGVVCGAQLTIALTLMAERARTQAHATALSGMAQSLGYAITAIGPFAFGVLHEWSGGWVAPFAVIWVSAIVQLVVGFAVGRPRFVLESK